MNNKIVYLHDIDFSVYNNREYFIDKGFDIDNIYRAHFLRVDFDKKVIDSNVYRSAVTKICLEHYKLDINGIETAYIIEKISGYHRLNGLLPDIEQIVFRLPDDYKKIVEIFNSMAKKKEKFKFVDFNIEL